MSTPIYKIALVLECGDEHGNVTLTRKFGARFTETAPGLAEELAIYTSNTIHNELDAFLEAAVSA